MDLTTELHDGPAQNFAAIWFPDRRQGLYLLT